jgi:hypothetical protein
MHNPTTNTNTPTPNGDLKTTFKNAKKLLDTTPFPKRRSKKFDLERAAAFYICRYFSYYGDGKSLNSKKSTANFIANLDLIFHFSNRLKGVEIKKGDAVYRLDRLTEIQKALIYIDAPYINTEKYYSINSDKPQNVFKSHTALQHRIEKLRHKNVCLISYRITASQSALTKNPNAEAEICACLDKLYKDAGYFYKLHKLKRKNKKTQIEILISTHQLKDFKEYTCNIETEVV